MNKGVLAIIALGALVMLGIIFSSGGGITEPVQNAELRDGVQYVTIEARGGYTPRVSVAKAGIPTKLIVKTNNTYDCSLSLVVRDANFQSILPSTGETEVDLGMPEAGKKITGTCGMGMYSFAIKFEP